MPKRKTLRLIYGGELDLENPDNLLDAIHEEKTSLETLLGRSPKEVVINKYTLSALSSGSMYPLAVDKGSLSVFGIPVRVDKRMEEPFYFEVEL